MAEAVALPEVLSDVFADHLRQLFASEPIVNAFITDFAAEQPGLGAADADELKAAARDLAPGWAHDGAVLGVARLPVEDRRRSLEMARHVLAAMPDDATCAAHTRGALEPAEVLRLELGTLAVLGAEAASEHLALVRRALLAEVVDDPPFVPMPDADARRAAAAYQEAVLAAVEADPARVAMMVVMQSFDTAEDAAVCRFAQLSLDAALSIEGEAGELVVRLLTAG
ncbi:MAG: hypothetical protein MUE98_16610 [Rhodobacteraceae bacterium]|nr:hypothetical protein [Paracoccaceae bacterium]